MVVEPDGPTCPCGHQGHLEAVASGPSIARIARERLTTGEASSMREAVDDLTDLTARHVGEAALDGDDLAVSIIRGAGRHIGIGIASLMVILNPDMFVLGGGVTKVGDLLFDPNPRSRGALRHAPDVLGERADCARRLEREYRIDGRGSVGTTPCDRIEERTECK